MSHSKKTDAWKAGKLPDKPVWYLGYGSNMSTTSMQDRKVSPLASKIVVVPTHYFNFDIFGIPYSEPSYASIEEFPSGESGRLKLVHGENCIKVPALCGVAYLLTPTDFHALLITEGSGVVYDVIEVQAYGLDERGAATGEPSTAYTLKAKWPQRPNGTPSARYFVRTSTARSKIVH